MKSINKKWIIVIFIALIIMEVLGVNNYIYKEQNEILVYAYTNGEYTELKYTEKTIIPNVKLELEEDSRNFNEGIAFYVDAKELEDIAYYCNSGNFFSCDENGEKGSYSNNVSMQIKKDYFKYILWGPYDFNIKKYSGYEVEDNIELKLFFKDKKIQSFDESLPVIKIAISYDKDGNVMGQLVK